MLMVAKVEFVIMIATENKIGDPLTLISLLCHRSKMGEDS